MFLFQSKWFGEFDGILELLQPLQNSIFQLINLPECLSVGQPSLNFMVAFKTTSKKQRYMECIKDKL